jgi:hypothetical protein
MSKIQAVCYLAVFCSNEEKSEKTVNIFIDAAGVPVMQAGKDGRLWPSFLNGVSKFAKGKRGEFKIILEIEADLNLEIEFAGNRGDLIEVCRKAYLEGIDVEPLAVSWLPVAKVAEKPATTVDSGNFARLMEFVKSHEVPDIKDPSKLVVLDGRSWKSLENLRTSLNRVVTVAMASDLEGTKGFLASLNGYSAEDFFSDIEAEKKGILGVEPEVTKALEKNFF